MTERVIAVVADLVERWPRAAASRSTGRSVADRVADGVEQAGQLPQQAAVLRDGVAQGDEDLLLARRAREVALAGRLAGPRVGERVQAVEVVRPAVIDKPGPRARSRRRSGRRSPGDVDVHAADGIDHADEARPWKFSASSDGRFFKCAAPRAV